MMSYIHILDRQQKKKKTLTGQMTLLDFAGEDIMIDDGIKMPDVEEYSKEQLLAFEKEVLGIYISGHPLEEYEKSINRNVTAFSSEFILDEEINSPKVGDGIKHLIGGMITEITIKSTRNNKTMAFLTLEDMLGTVEIIVFPREFDKYKIL